MKQADRLEVHGAPGRCPFCRDVLSDPKQTVACAACGARHHEACHREHGACATCGATDVLVPRSRARVRREQPPRGSTIEVERDANGVLTYSWPAIQGQAAGLWVLLGVVFSLMFGLGLPILIGYAWRRAQRPLARMALGDGVLDLTIPGAFSDEVITLRREEMGAIRLERIAQAGLRLTIDVGVERKPIGQFTQMIALKEPELEWLYEALIAWKEEGGA